MPEETEPKELKWLREYSNGRKELKENALKNNSLPDFASFDLEFWKKIYEEGKQAGATELQEEMKKDLVLKLKELISYSTSPSCTKGMELFIKRIEDWEFIK